FISMLDQKDGKYSHYVVMSTSDCNARCFYCYQMGRNKARTHMSNETAKEVARFIKDTASNKISIQWYGGEPLYNDSVIDIICIFLRENGIVYTSSMITNGYLLDKPVIEKAKDLWNVERVQVAIDGTEETYNRCKAYIYKDDVSPYRRVISNIKEALDADIKVSVRVNMDNHNVKEMYELVDELWHYFGEYEGFSVYAAGLYENVGPNNPVRTAQSRMELTDNLIAFEEYCSQKGLKIHRKFSDKLTLNRCMADNRKSVTISQDGLLGKCDHLMETDTFGSVFSDRVDTSILASFRERLNTREMCGKCPVYPECIRLRKCKDDGGGCDAAYQKLKIYKTRRRIENVLKNKNKAE
ncbi:MAG: radical SAM protein, partial [Clostridia bacterium]|nr:radical SAM protein [Clostridia bacterium]